MKYIFGLLLFPLFLFSEIHTSPNYLYDSNQVRYELYRTNGGEPYNWLFFPGGPGADSSYFRRLVDELELPGNVWLVDLPGNGTNNQSGENFDRWFDVFPTLVKRFDNPIMVGHSFGGMFPLLFPEMESYVKGLVILNSFPRLWKDEALACAKEFDLPDFTQAMQEFTLNPTQETFNAALEACLPYYFPKHSLEKGKDLLLQVPFNYKAALWWQKKRQKSISVPSGYRKTCLH